MCIVGTVGRVSVDTIHRHVDRYSFDTQPSHGRYLVDILPILGRQPAETLSTYRSCINRESVAYRAVTYILDTNISADKIDYISVNYRWYIGVVSKEEYDQLSRKWTPSGIEKSVR